MADEIKSKSPLPPRIVDATGFRGDELLGPIEILGNTKHGTTSMVGVGTTETLQPGDVLKTKSWVFGSRQLVIVKAHQKPMKLPGVWYEVRVIAPQAKAKSAPKSVSASGPKRTAKSAPRK